MSRVITFSRCFPAYHPKAGQPTYFVEKIWDATSLPFVDNLRGLTDEMVNFMRRGSNLIWPKYHTIRQGNRFKPGDKFSPRVWSGKPYRSKQIIIAPDIEIVKTWNFEIHSNLIFLNGQKQNTVAAELIAKNDGLEFDDFLKWFKYPKLFGGQVICWNPDITY